MYSQHTICEPAGNAAGSRLVKAPESACSSVQIICLSRQRAGVLSNAFTHPAERHTLIGYWWRPCGCLYRLRCVGERKCDMKTDQNDRVPKIAEKSMEAR